MSRYLYYVMDQSAVAEATCICEFLELRCGGWSHPCVTGTPCSMSRPFAIMCLERALAWGYVSKSAWVKLWFRPLEWLYFEAILFYFSRKNDPLYLCFMKENCKSMTNFLYICNSNARFLPISSLVYFLNSVFAFIHLQKISQPSSCYFCVCFTWFVSSSHLFESCLIAILNASFQCQSYIAARSCIVLVL